jgi:hypothetical protein
VKRIFLLILVCSCLNGVANSGRPVLTIQSLPPDTTVLSQILALPLNTYIEKPVDSLLTLLPANFISRKIHGWGSLKYAQVLRIVYPNDIRVLIFVKEFTHMNRRSDSLDWNINLFKLEKTKCVEIWQGAVLKSSECLLND